VEVKSLHEDYRIKFKLDTQNALSITELTSDLKAL